MADPSAVLAAHTRTNSAGWGSFILSVFKHGPSLTREERLQKAKQRWAECRKLRLLQSSLSLVKDEQESKLMQPYYGVVKLDQGESFIPTKPFLIYPNTPMQTFLDSLAALTIVYFSFVSSYRIGFYTDEENERIRWYDLVCDATLLLYSLTRFVTAYVEDIEVVDDRWLIALRYARTTFIPDLVAALPLYSLEANFLWLKLFRLLHIGLVSQLLTNFVDFLSKTLGKLVITWQVKIALDRILQFFLYLSIICHLIACGWHFLAIKEGVPLAETWQQGVEMTNTEAYVVSVYWVLVTFTTVGYGDITPKTDLEIVYAMVVQFIGILFFAYLVGSMSSIASTWNKWELAISKQENDLEKWLMMLDRNRPDKRLKPELHASIRNYFLYIWKYDHSILISNSGFFMRLPNELRRELTSVLFAETVQKFRAFTYKCEEDLAFALVLNMFPRKFKKFELIVAEGTLPSEMYFIDKGMVHVTVNHGSVTCVQLMVGGFVGDFELIFREGLEASYQ